MQKVLLDLVSSNGGELWPIERLYLENKVIAKHAPEWQVFRDRYENLSGMNEIVRSMNDERAYMSWIYDVPDEATADDLVYICCDDDLFADCVRKFIHLMYNYGKYGLYIGEKLYS